MAEVELCIRAPGGAVCFEARAPVEWTIGDVKAQIQSALGTPISQQRLIMPTVKGLKHHQPGLDDCEPLSAVLAPGAQCVKLDLAHHTEEHFRWMQRIWADPQSLRHAPDHIRDDREVVKFAVQRDGSALQYASEALRADHGVVLEAVGQSGGSLVYAAPALRNDPLLVLEAVGRNVGALTVASPELLADRDFLVQAVNRHPSAIVTVPRAFRGDEGFIRSAMQRSATSALRGATPELQAERGLVVLAVGIDGMALEFASKELRGDREVVLAAVRQNGLALQFGSRAMRGDRDVVLAAVQQAGMALAFASQALRSDADVVFAALRAPRGEAEVAEAGSGAEPFELASLDLRDDPLFVQRAAQLNPAALRFATVRLRGDKDFVEAVLTGGEIEVISDEEDPFGEEAPPLEAAPPHPDAPLSSGKAGPRRGGGADRPKASDDPAPAPARGRRGSVVQQPGPRMGRRGSAVA